jgi:hypothetical protein
VKREAELHVQQLAVAHAEGGRQVLGRVPSRSASTRRWRSALSCQMPRSPEVRPSTSAARRPVMRSKVGLTIT